MHNPKLRKITLKFEDETEMSWNPLDIHKIEIYKDYIRINDEVIKKSDCYYPSWACFINQLNRWFIL